MKNLLNKLVENLYVAQVELILTDWVVVILIPLSRRTRGWPAGMPP